MKKVGAIKNHCFKRSEYEIVLILSNKYSISKLCSFMGLSKSGFYDFKRRLFNPSQKEINRKKILNCLLNIIINILVMAIDGLMRRFYLI